MRLFNSFQFRISDPNESFYGKTSSQLLRFTVKVNASKTYSHFNHFRIPKISSFLFLRINHIIRDDRHTLCVVQVSGTRTSLYLIGCFLSHIVVRIFQKKIVPALWLLHNSSSGFYTTKFISGMIAKSFRLSTIQTNCLRRKINATRSFLEKKNQFRVASHLNECHKIRFHLIGKIFRSNKYQEFHKCEQNELCTLKCDQYNNNSSKHFKILW